MLTAVYINKEEDKKLIYKSSQYCQKEKENWQSSADSKSTETESPLQHLMFGQNNGAGFTVHCMKTRQAFAAVFGYITNDFEAKGLESESERLQY